MITFRNRLARFRRNESGSISVELLLMLPILIWTFLAPLQYFDAYRAELISNKAALTIADIYSRETGYVTPQYLNGTRDLLKSLTRSDSDPDYRVTVFFWHEGQKKYKVAWSRNRGSRQNMRTSDLAAISHRLPVLSHLERALLVQTWTDYDPRYGKGVWFTPGAGKGDWTMAGTGLGDVEFKTFLVASPRFAPTICFNATPEDPTKEKC